MNKTTQNYSGDNKIHMTKHRRLSLVIYDVIILLFVDLLVLGFSSSVSVKLDAGAFFLHTFISAVCIYLCRYFARVYKQVWRYGSSSAYIRLIIADVMAGILYFVIQTLIPFARLGWISVFSVIAFNLLLTLSIRMLYQYLYERANRDKKSDGIFWKVMEIFTGLHFSKSDEKKSDVNENTKIKIAIVGAGRVGAMLAEELVRHPRSSYLPCCFIDIDKAKIGREVAGLPVLSSEEATAERLAAFPIQEIVFALPEATPERKKELYEHYKKTGCRLKVYDYPVMQTAEKGKRHLREFDIEELLFRQPVEFNNPKTNDYYKDKIVLITGGGGSIGSELCRQIAKMQPKTLIILDVYENGAYDVQQELRIKYGAKLDLHVEIVSVCDYEGLENVFETYHPDILIHAAAHKHVPLMEHNCCEAVKNNVFGTLNTVKLCEKYKVGRFMMVSTDKAVNPTNVMGATKRMCEMIVQSYIRSGSGTVYSATRFGNVLGSAGSVIPLFKKQIMNGGPITVTDKRIIRYFMTIPEASQLVLQSGAMAQNGELFVLDMGKPVRILELAENMIHLSGYEPYRDIDIIETGLRPGEKLYEELLIRTEELDKTESDMIFIERDEPLELKVIEEKLNVLREAIVTNNNENVKRALKAVVPTFHNPEDVNRNAVRSQEMQEAAMKEKIVV